MIQNTDIKLMASEQLNDSDTGGGSMTAVEVVDGVLNNLFNDISRTDRTRGRVALRKGFLSVQTNTTDDFLGAHAIISQRAADPAVGVVMFGTASLTDQRAAARSRMEAYVAKGGRTIYEIYGDHLIGSRTLRLHAAAINADDLSTLPPEIEQVLVLQSGEQQQFLRVAAVSGREVQMFTVAGGNGTRTFYRQIITCALSSPLTSDFLADEVTDLVVGDPTTAVHDTSPGADSVYYGCMAASAALSAGQAVVTVDDVFTQLVPTADVETPFVDWSPWVAGDAVRTHAYAVTAGTRRYNWTHSVAYDLIPGNLTVDFRVFGKWVRLSDNGSGNLVGKAGQGSGTINYATGSIIATLGALPDLGSQVIFTWRTENYAAVSQAQTTFNLAAGSYTVTLGTGGIVPGTVWVAETTHYWFGTNYFDDAAGNLKNGSGTIVGSLDYGSGLLTWTAGGDPGAMSAQWQTTPAAPRLYTFRIEGAPLALGSVQIEWPTFAGHVILSSQPDGTLTGGGAGGPTGTIDYQTGLTQITTGGNGYISSETILISGVRIARTPLDASLIGIDPVRMPSDGRVAVVQAGQSVVIHHTADTELPPGLSSGLVTTLPRANLAWVEAYDSAGARIPEDRYALDGAAGTITWENPINLAGFIEPVSIRHRIEEMRLVTDVQFTGEITLARPLLRAFPEGTQVSTLIEFGDLKSRVAAFFRQATWTGVWQDTVIGNTPSGSYNDAIYPLALSNRGAIPQRWALVFTSATAFNILSEDLGVIGTGTTLADCEPTNPATAVPYFSLAAAGWSGGWAAGNVLRFNTAGTVSPFWLARTTQIDPEGFGDDDFRVELRGDVQ